MWRVISVLVLYCCITATSQAATVKGDMDGDGEITIVDAVKVLRTVVGLIAVVYDSATPAVCGPAAPVVCEPAAPAVYGAAAPVQLQNSAPIANAGADQTVSVWDKVVLNAAGSKDLDGDLLGYRWKIENKPVGSSVVLQCEECLAASFTTDIAGVYSISLSVHDGRVYSPSVKVTITAVDPPAKLGAVIKKLPFPSGITWIGDMAYDKATSSLWALTGNNASLNTLTQIDINNGSVLASNSNNNWSINHSSSLAYDGQYLWATSYGTSNGVPQSYIYKLSTGGAILTQFACPATTTGGYCNGLAWDGSALWSGASDNKNLTRFGTEGSIQTQYVNVFTTVGLNNLDIAFDTISNRLIITKDGVKYIDPLTGTITNTVAVYTVHGGAWDGALYWQPNNSTLEIEAFYLGQIK